MRVFPQDGNPLRTVCEGLLVVSWWSADVDPLMTAERDGTRPSSPPRISGYGNTSYEVKAKIRRFLSPADEFRIRLVSKCSVRA